MPLYAPNQRDNFSFRSFINKLIDTDDIQIIDSPVTGYEIAEISSKACKAGGKALLFNGEIPIAVNLLASDKRIETALGMSISSAAEKTREFIKNKPDLQLSFDIPDEYTGIKLSDLPIKKHYEGDISGSLNMACVISRDRNYSCGIYRIQPLNDGKAVIHCLPGSDLAKQLTSDIPVTIAIGTSPHLIYGAAASLPAGTDELTLAAHLHPSDMLFIHTTRYPVPLGTQIIIQGTVSANEKHPEGPFFNYKNAYSEVSDFPVMKIESVKIIKDGIYHTTVTGEMPMETTYILNAVKFI